MAKKNVRRPTEDIALARAMKDKDCIGNPELLQKIMMDEMGIKYRVWYFHTTIGMSMSKMWKEWKETGKSMHFVNYLHRRGIIYQYTIC